MDKLTASAADEKGARPYRANDLLARMVFPGTGIMPNGNSVGSNRLL